MFRFSLLSVLLAACLSVSLATIGNSNGLSSSSQYPGVSSSSSGSQLSSSSSIQSLSSSSSDPSSLSSSSSYQSLSSSSNSLSSSSASLSSLSSSSYQALSSSSSVPLTFSVSPVDGATCLAGASTLLATQFAIVAPPTVSFSATASVDIGSLSASSFAAGTLASMQAALSAWTYTAPVITPPSSYYPATDAHYFGSTTSQARALLTINVTTALGMTSYTVTLTIQLVNQQPTINVTKPSLYANVALAPNTTWPVDMSGLHFGDVDSWGEDESVTVQANGGSLCWPNAGSTVCAPSLEVEAPLDGLGSLNTYMWNLTFYPAATATANTTMSVTVTLNDEYNSGAQVGIATHTIPISIIQPGTVIQTVPQVAVAPVNVVQVDPYTLQVNWPAYMDKSAGNANISYYQVSYGTAAKGTINTFNVMVGSGNISYSAVLPYLQPGNLYWVTLSAGNNVGLTTPSTYNLANARAVYPVTAFTCGSTQYCGAQWTQEIVEPAPTIRVSGDGVNAFFLYTYIAPINAGIDASYYYLFSYATVTNGVVGAYSTPQQLYAGPLGYVSTVLVGFQPSTSYVVRAVMYSPFFGLYSQPANMSYATLAYAPTITSFTVSDPYKTAVPSNFISYHTGLQLSIKFSTAVTLPTANIDPSMITFSAQVGTLSSWSQTDASTITAYVLNAGTNAANVQLGLLTASIGSSVNITSAAAASYAVNSTSPALTGTFGALVLDSSALTVAASTYTTSGTTIQLVPSLVNLTGTGTNYSYTITIVAPSVANLTSTVVNTLSSPTTYSFTPSTGGASLAAVQTSLAALSIVVPQYWSGSVQFSVIAYTFINGSYMATSAALGTIVVLPTYHAPQIMYTNTTTILTVPVSTSSIALAAYVPGITFYDIDADTTVDAYASPSANYTLTVRWSTASPMSYLTYNALVGGVVAVPDNATLAGFVNAQGGVSSFVAIGSIAALQAVINSVSLSSFKFDTTLGISTLNIQLVNAQSMSTSVQFTLLQSVNTVPATTITGVYLLPNQQSIVVLLADTVTTPLAVSQAKFDATTLFNTSQLSFGATCAFLPASPITAFSVSAASAYIQCVFGLGAALSASTLTTTAIPTAAGNSVLQRISGGQVASNSINLYIQLLPGLAASIYGTPAFTLSGTSTVSYCPGQSISVKPIVSGAGIGAGTQYQWTVFNAALGFTDLLANAGVSLRMSTISIPNIDPFNVFTAGVFSFQLTVTNLANMSSTQTFSVTRQTSPAPTLLGASSQTNSITDLILLSFTPQLPGSCFTNATTIVYQWTTVNNNVTLDTKSANTSTLAFVKPYSANGLSYGQSYTFKLTASLAGIANSNVASLVTLTIRDLPLVAGIAGPSAFQVGDANGFNLTTVGASQLPTQANVYYAWSCTSTSGSCGVTGTLSTLAVPALTAGFDYTFVVYITAVAAGVSTTAQASVTVSVVAGTPVPISITAYKGASLVQGGVIVNDFSSLRLTASTGGVTAKYVWSCAACPAAFNASFNGSTTASLPLNAANTAGYWTALSTYLFRVDVTPMTGSFAASFSSILVTVNTPPTAPVAEAIVITGPGSVTGSPLAGYANGIDQWTLSVAQSGTALSGWTGTGSLSYQFFYVTATGAVQFLTSVSSALSITTPLPLGYGANNSLPVGVMVFDSNGGQSSYQVSGINAPIVTLQANVSATQLLGNLLSSASNLSPSSFLSAVVSIASAATSAGNGSAAAGLAQRVSLLNAVANNIASVSPGLALQAINSIVGGGAVSDPSAINQAALILASVLTNALTDPTFISTPSQLGNFLSTVTGMMNSNKQSVSTGNRRRLLDVSSGAQETTQQSTDALYAQAMDAISTAFIGTAAAPVSQFVANAGALVYRAAYIQGLAAPDMISANNVTVTVAAGPTWLLPNPIPTDGTSAYDIQVGIVSPDPLLNLLTNVTATFAGVTVWFDVVTVNGGASQALTFTNTTDAPALAFNMNDVPAMAALLSNASQYAVQCVQWDYTNGYTAIITSAIDSTGAFTCQPATTSTYVSYAAVSTTQSSGPTTGSTGTTSSSSSSGVNTNRFAYLFSGYNGSRSAGGYYFWMAVSIALCLLFPVFALTYRPSRSNSAASAKQRAMEYAQPNKQQVHIDDGAYAVSHPTKVAKDEIVAASAANEEQRSRQGTLEDTMDYGDVNALKRNVYHNEEKDQSEETGQEDVGFVIHQ